MNQETMKIRISYDDGPDSAVALLEGLVHFFGGEAKDVTPDERGLTWVEYEVKRNDPPEPEAVR